MSGLWQVQGNCSQFKKCTYSSRSYFVKSPAFHFAL
jgi:hypothetical protein